eukprot:SAG31_NODE_3107_length_4667_cov_4.409807_1_plen_67_part_00
MSSLRVLYLSIARQVLNLVPTPQMLSVFTALQLYLARYGTVKLYGTEFFIPFGTALRPWRAIIFAI